MARPIERGADGWSLVQVANAAGITRGVARSAVARGYLPADRLDEAHILLLQVAAACMDFPDPTEPVRPKSDPQAARPGRRDATALRFARAVLADPATSWHTAIVLAGMDVEVTETAEELTRALDRAGTQTALVLPVGRWILQLPSAHRGPRGQLHLVPDAAAPPPPTGPTTAPYQVPAYAAARKALDTHVELEMATTPVDDPFGDLS